MTKKTRGLGAGFAALLSNTTVTASQAESADELVNLSVSVLTSGRFQPRTQWDEASLQELSSSIKAQGVIQPIVVRSLSGGHYEIIAGERRWRAAKLAGLEFVPVIIKSLDDQSALAIALIENIQRENLSVIEEAKAMKKLAEAFSLTHEQVAQAVGRSREAVSNSLRLLKLENSIQEAVMDGQLSAGHARCLVALSESDQQRIAQQAISLQWSVRELEQVVRQLGQQVGKAKSITEKNQQNQDWFHWQKQISEVLGLPVKLSQRASGKGKLEITFDDVAALEELLKKLS